jgi:sarcosine oxidase subunit beta
VQEPEGLYLAAGLCGQGFMLGPGLGKNLANLILRGQPLIDPAAFASMSFHRDLVARKKKALNRPAAGNSIGPTSQAA